MIVALTSDTSKIILKILQVRLRQYVNFQMFKLDLENAEEAEIKLTASVDHRKTKKIPEKHLLLILIIPKPLTV